MKKFEASKLTKQQNYKLLSGSVIPRPIAFITSQDTNGTLNAAPFSFFNVVNSEPPMIMISTTRSDGKRKDTSLNIEATEEFVVHITDEVTVEQINRTAAPIDRNINELERTELTIIDSDLVSVPGIEQAKIRLECKLDRIIALGDVDEGSDLIIGEVVMFHIDDNVYIEPHKVDANNLKAVSRLAGNNYAKLGESFIIERPTK
ncbi:flavin reductase family protein [Staphylococcus sp. ACRSN]|uniref:flavin reductase family protein n=1 Tax=Staphylococcus sp. ACRSN TaxID=2918214 RepID=UPI001EF374F6|nr:flavin reductase family protein [Staphylococcus sp. ACRSN]MCG7338208.1 flavin reductase family protein [Staphylococcus sp. ACRSN]